MKNDFYLGSYIYQNGYLNQSLLSSNGIFYGTNEFHLLLNISTYQGDEAGEYFVIVYTDSHALIFEYGCSTYFHFIGFSLWLFSLIWQVETLQIHTTSKTLLYIYKHTYIYIYIYIYVYCPCLMSCTITMANLFDCQYLQK